MGKRILVIEDDPSSARLVGYALEREGYQVEIAVNGVEGLRKAQEEQPDLVILDVMLPGLDGFEVCHRLRADSTTDHVPILMLSAKAQEIDKSTGLKVGADEYLVKPADPAEILANVERLLAEESAATVPARTIAFLGSEGGVGTSTVAVNVAVAVARANKGAIVVDLAPYCGNVPTLLGIEPEHTVAEIFGTSQGTLDRHQVEEILIAHSTGVRVLCRPQSVEGYREFSPPSMVSLVEVFRTMGDYVLLDMSAHSSEADKAVLAKCDFIVVVTGSGRDGLANAGATVTMLEKLGMGRDRLGAVVVDRDGFISELEPSRMAPIVESTIGVPLLAIVPNDVKASLESESQGMPVVLADLKRPMAASLMQVADRIMSANLVPQGGADD